MCEREGIIRQMESTDLPRVLEWRNSPEIKRFMYTQHHISLEEHTAWFERASRDPKRHLLIFELNNVPLGFINIHEKIEGGIADWGFYTAPDLEKGSGSKLGSAGLLYAFSFLKLYKLNGQALGYNHKSIRFHERLGFKKEGILRDQHFDGKSYHDVICFGLLSSEWKL